MKVPECKFYDSKMRPLLLVYENPDTHSVTKDVRIMFKHGDGKYDGQDPVCTCMCTSLQIFGKIC